MTRRPESDLELVLDILEAIREIEGHAPDQATFDGSTTVQKAVAYELQRIGEVANRISHATRQLAPEIPWPRITGDLTRLQRLLGAD